MSRYILIRRLRGPAFLLLVGFIALMNQAHIMSWGHAWPLFLILAGVLALAERAAISAEGYPPPADLYTGAYQAPYPPPYPGAPYQPGTVPPAPSAPGASIVPVNPDDHARNSDGGQS